jgi:hypothetical protein
MNWRMTWLSVALLIGVVVTLRVFGEMGMVRTRRANTCVRCGAEQENTHWAFRFFNLRTRSVSSSKIQTTALTELWSRYATPCLHDWTFHYVNTDGPGSGLRGCAFPEFKHPAASSAAAKRMAAQIEALNSPQICSNVLRAIGHRENLLRFSAAGALAEYSGSLEQSSSSLKNAEKL